MIPELDKITIDRYINDETKIKSPYFIPLNVKTSIDYSMYAKKDILYIYEFTPLSINHLSRQKLGRKYYEFGVSSNIEKRDKAHMNDKNKINPILIKIFQYNSRYNVSMAESYIKKIVKEMKISIKYFKSIECFVADKNELDLIFNIMSQHQYNNNKMTSSADLNVKKIDAIKDLFISKHITFDEYMSYMNNLK